MSQPDRAEAAAALVLLSQRRAHLAELLEHHGSAITVLRDTEGGNLDPPRLFNGEDPHVQELLDYAAADLAVWESAGIRMLSVLDPGYPQNLRGVHDRPPVVFVQGTLGPGDERAVAVIGSRRASAAGVRTARAIAGHLVAHDYTVVSGLAAGIDTAAHTATLKADGRTIAVIGTGLKRCYPPENAALQRRIAHEGAVISRFWPDAGPTRRSFPARNAVMSGLSRATVIVEASPRSGARGQARMALAHGRPVFLYEPLLEQEWAREMARAPGGRVFTDPGDVTSALHGLETGELVG